MAELVEQVNPLCVPSLFPLEHEILGSIENLNVNGFSLQDAYNMAELQVSIQTSPAYSLNKKKERPTKPKSFFCAASPSTQEWGRTSVATGASLSSGDFGQYLSDVVRNADRDPRAAPQDLLRVFCTEGEGSAAGSLSSLSSSGPEEGIGYDDLKEWGPKFEKLSELYSQRGAEDL